MIKKETATECVCECVLLLFVHLFVWSAISEWVACEKKCDAMPNNNQEELWHFHLPHCFYSCKRHCINPVLLLATTTKNSYVNFLEGTWSHSQIWPRLLFQFVIQSPELNNYYFFWQMLVRIETIAIQLEITPIIITFILNHRRCFAVCKRQVNQKWWWTINFLKKQENISSVVNASKFR